MIFYTLGEAYGASAGGDQPPYLPGQPRGGVAAPALRTYDLRPFTPAKP